MDIAVAVPRARTRTNTNANDTEANAAGRRGVRVRSANYTCENQGAWVAMSLIKSEARPVYEKKKSLVLM
jgi:hypothetical protein